MSWSMQGGEVELGRDIHEQTMALAATPQQGYAESESAFAIGQARDAVRRILESGAFGDEGIVKVSGNGHSNPGGTPEGNWAQDCMSISLTKQP